MAQQTIGLGTLDNDGTGDNLKVAGGKINANFTELYAAVIGALVLKGATDASGNPNYPAASKGYAYIVTVAGKVGGASGVTVAAGDMYFALADNAGGTQAAVGTSWAVVEHNLVGPLLAANNLSDVANPATARGNLGLAIGTDVQAYDADLTAIAALTTDAFGRSVLTKASAQAICALIEAPWVVGQSGVAVSHTGNTTETTLATITIPANTIGPNGQVEIISLWSYTNSGNTKNVRAKFGGSQVLWLTPTTSASLGAYNRGAAKNSASSQRWGPSSAGSAFGTTGGSPFDTSIDTTANVDIILTAQLANSGETITLESYIVKVTYRT